MNDTKVSKQIGVRVPNAMYAALVALAKAQRRSVGFVIRDFIDAGLRREAKGEDGETLTRAELAICRWASQYGGLLRVMGAPQYSNARGASSPTGKRHPLAAKSANETSRPTSAPACRAIPIGATTTAASVRPGSKTPFAAPAEPPGRPSGAGMMGEVEVDHSFDCAKSDLFSATFCASVVAGHLDALAVSECEVRLRPPIEALRRAASGLDLDPSRRDFDHVSVADQQPDAAEVDAAPCLWDAKKFVARPAEALELVAMAGGEEGPRTSERGRPVISGCVRWAGKLYCCGEGIGIRGVGQCGPAPKRRELWPLRLLARSADRMCGRRRCRRRSVGGRSRRLRARPRRSYDRRRAAWR